MKISKNIIMHFITEALLGILIILPIIIMALFLDGKPRNEGMMFLLGTGSILITEAIINFHEKRAIRECYQTEDIEDPLIFKHINQIEYDYSKKRLRMNTVVIGGIAALLFSIDLRLTWIHQSLGLTAICMSLLVILIVTVGFTIYYHSKHGNDETLH
ncbi:MAG: hypothetical protein RR565_06895 [Erysipelothrix sp.]